MGGNPGTPTLVAAVAIAAARLRIGPAPIQGIRAKGQETNGHTITQETITDEDAVSKTPTAAQLQDCSADPV
jgi:hypothetical protein